MTTDIIGKADAHAARLDKEAADAVKKAQLHWKVATTIFFESNGGMSQARADASVPEIKTDVFGPESNMADLDNVLEGMASTCYYLNWDRNRHRFGLTPNLNQILVNRRGAVSPKAINDRVRKQTEELFGKYPKDISTPLGRATKEVTRKYSPQRTNNVPNQPALTLVVLGLDAPHGEKRTTDLMESVIRDCGATGRTYKSALIFAVPDAGETVQEAARYAESAQTLVNRERVLPTRLNTSTAPRPSPSATPAGRRAPRSARGYQPAGAACARTPFSPRRTLSGRRSRSSSHSGCRSPRPGEEVLGGDW